MDLPTTTSRSQLTISDIEDYQSCGLLYKFSRIDGLEMDPVPGDLIYESAIRKTLIEHNTTWKEGNELSLNSVHEKFAQNWENETSGKTILYRPGMNHDKFLAQGKTLLSSYYHWFPRKQFEVLSVGTSHKMHIDGVDVPIVGEFDYIERDNLGIFIVTHYIVAYRIRLIDHLKISLRLSLLHMLSVAKGLPHGQLLLQPIWLMTTGNQKVTQNYIHRSDMELKFDRRTVRTIWDGISKGVFIPNPGSWKCNYCGYKCECKAWFGF